MNDFDILLLSETWISSKNTINLEINGYFCEHIFGNKTPGSVKGRFSSGISVYAKNHLKSKIKIIEKNLWE